jgi:hypothetical protein
MTTSSDVLWVRALVAVLAWLNFGLRLWIWRHAYAARPGVAGLLLRGRAVSFASYCLNTALMSTTIVLPLGVPVAALIVWRNIVRLHAQLALVVVVSDILLNEVHKKRAS